MLKFPPNIIEREPLKKVKPKLLQGIGLVIVAHSRLELLLTELIYDLLRIDYPLGRQVIRGDNPVETFKTIQRLLDVWDIKIGGLGGLRRDIEVAYAKRNQLAHGVWVRIKGNDVRLRLVREKRPTAVGVLDRRILPEFAKVRIAQFQKDASYIHKVTARVRALQKHVAVVLRAWPKIVPSRLPRRQRSRPAGRSGKSVPTPP
jgi:hypothetical protein